MVIGYASIVYLIFFLFFFLLFYRHHNLFNWHSLLILKRKRKPTIEIEVGVIEKINFFYKQISCNEKRNKFVRCFGICARNTYAKSFLSTYIGCFRICKRNTSAKSFVNTIVFQAKNPCLICISSNHIRNPSRNVGYVSRLIWHTLNRLVLRSPLKDINHTFTRKSLSFIRFLQFIYMRRVRPG